MTKIENFEAIRNFLEGSGIDNEDDILEFLDAEIARLEASAKKSKERAAKKRAENDELTEEIFAILTNEGKSGEEILEELGRDDITKQKVATRMKKLIDEGRATKDFRKEDKRKIVVYMAADAAEAGGEEE